MGDKKHKAAVADTKKPDRATVVEERDYQNLRPNWSFAILDIGGPWCWRQMDNPTFMYVLQELKGFGTMNWVEIKNAGSHDVAQEELIQEARYRLEELKMDDIEKVYSLRLSGKQRIWELRIGQH